MSRTTIQVEHICREVPKAYDEFKEALERQLGHFDPAVYQRLAADPQEARRRIEAMAGSSGFMIFSTSNHGLVLRLVGKSGKAMQYVLGNPLLAVEMTRHAIGAALYAPLRMLVYEATPGDTRVEYDLPSSLFGQFGNAEIDRVAASLDDKMAALIAAAAA